MKKLLGIIFMLFVGFALVACEVEEGKPTPEDEIEDVIPEEDEEPAIDEEDEEPEIDEEDKEPEIIEEDKEPEIIEEDEEPVIDEEAEDTVTLYESSGEREVWKTLELDTEGYSTLIITIKGDYAHDIPVNFDNWKVNKELVTYEGLTGNKYQVNKDITIGGLPTVVTLVNLHQKQVRLHTVATASTPEGHEGKNFIRVDVSTVNTFGFDFTVTTAAFAYIDGLQITLMSE